MERFKFLRRKSDTARYNRAKKLLESVTFPSIRKKLQKVVDEYETESEIIKLFVNNENLQKRSCDRGDVWFLPMKFVSMPRGSDKYVVVDGEIHCYPAHKENYVESWRNIGTEYHSLYVEDKTNENGYWLLNEATLEQMKNQDTIEERCRQMNLLLKNYF